MGKSKGLDFKVTVLNRNKDISEEYKKEFIDSEDTSNKKRKKKKKKHFTDILESFNENKIDVDEMSDINTTKVILNKTTATKKVSKSKIDKNADDFFEKRFSNELVMLYDLLKDGIITRDDSKNFLEIIKKSGTRNGKLITDMYSNVTLTSRMVLDIIKEINNLKTKVSDLEIKKFKDSYKAGGTVAETDNASKELRDEYILDKLFSNIQNVVSPLSKSQTLRGSSISENGFSVEKELDVRLKEMEDAGDLELTDNDYNTKYENSDVKLYIQKNDSNGTWKVIAMDGNDMILDDYRVPPNENLGDVKFFEDEGYAEDKHGRKYDLISTSII